MVAGSGISYEPGAVGVGGGLVDWLTLPLEKEKKLRKETYQKEQNGYR